MFSFPDPVDERAARIVALGVVLLGLAAVVSRQAILLVPLADGFWARLLTGPKLSPLGQLATRVVAPSLPGRPRLVPGPPKRFAQGVGVAFSSTALILWYGFGSSAAYVVVSLLVAAAFLEAAFGLCLGCKSFAMLMRIGVVPARICQACADLTLHQPS
jgi:hypothetical protein